MRHLALGAWTGVTVFAIVVPFIHMLAELAMFVGVRFSNWDNPVEVFIFLMTAAMMGVFPWGLWITLTDARKASVFDAGQDFAVYLIAAMGVFVVLILLVSTRLQPLYVQFRWVLSPGLFVCGVALLCLRWTKLWAFPSRPGVRGILENALAVEQAS